MPQEHYELVDGDIVMDKLYKYNSENVDEIKENQGEMNEEDEDEIEEEEDDEEEGGK